MHITNSLPSSCSKEMTSKKEASKLVLWPALVLYNIIQLQKEVILHKNSQAVKKSAARVKAIFGHHDFKSFWLLLEASPFITT